MKRVAEFKEKNAVLFDNLLPSDEKVAILEHNVVNVLKGTDHKGRRVLFVNCGKTWDPSKVSADQILRLLYLVHLLAMQEPETQVITSEHISFLFIRRLISGSRNPGTTFAERFWGSSRNCYKSFHILRFKPMFLYFAEHFWRVILLLNQRFYRYSCTTILLEI